MVKKVIVIILLILSIIIILNSNTYASGMDAIISDGDNFIGAGKDSVINENALGDTSDYMFNIFFSIAVVLAVAVGLILGIQFMVGSAEDQAKIKEALIPYVIGVFVVFAAFPIWKIVVKLGNQVAPSVSGPSGSGQSGSGQSGSGQGEVRKFTIYCELKDIEYETKTSWDLILNDGYICYKCHRNFNDKDCYHEIR